MRKPNKNDCFFFKVNGFVGEWAHPNLMLLAILLTAIEKQRIGNQMNLIGRHTIHNST
jgi:hypothetical protein